MAAAAARLGKAFSFIPAARIKEFAAPTVWHEFTPLARECQAVNLGQGFPGFQCPDFVKQALCRAVNEDHNQYARSAGHLRLVKALGERYSRFLKRPINPETEVVVTTGATEAMYAVMQGLVEPGDEVVVLEPSFDIYLAQSRMAGAHLRSVPLRLENGRWTLDMKEFDQAFSDKTRIFLLNTPHNPTGKVFTRAELERLAVTVRKYPNVVVVSDEVYEFLCFDGREHVRIASLPDMFDRTITVSSAGKTFSVTGWKVGWAVGPAHLIRSLGIVHQWVSFSTSNPVQEAVAAALDRADQPFEGHLNYYSYLLDMYTRKRNLLAAALRGAGITPVMPEGSFFIMGDTSHIRLPDPYASDKSVTRDWSLCRYLTREIGVAAIPPSAFYRPETQHLAANLARFAFCKEDSEIIEAQKRLLKLASLEHTQ